MSRSSEASSCSSAILIAVKSKFEAEFRRFSFEKNQYENFEDFRKFVEDLHFLSAIPFDLKYIDPKDGYLLPITNDDNFKKSIESSRSLRIIIQRKGESTESVPNGSSNKLPSILSSFVPQAKNKLIISNPQDFRQVAAIIDVDVVPEVCRRVRLLKHGSDKPLGFYIRDGSSVRVTPSGIERVPGIYISRLVPGGLAESTGLLAVNDEVVEVNGIEVQGKTLDQVTDMMVANSSNLIITVKPANQRTTPHGPNRGSFSRNSAISSGSQQSQQSANSDEDVIYEQDEIRDLSKGNSLPPTNPEDEGILHL